MKRIAIFGGTFDPVHKEHITLVNKAIEALNLDKLIVMPTYQPPHKEVAKASGEHRFNMLKIAFDDNPKVEVSDYELNRGGKSYTYITVSHFNKLYQTKPYFLVGGDMLKDFPTWKNPQSILNDCILCAFGRQSSGFNLQREMVDFEKRFNTNFVYLDYEGENCSSTKIRVYSMLNLDINDLTPKKVKEYIESNGLYKNFKYSNFLINNLTQKRLLHTANVAVKALEKAKELNLDQTKVLTACLLHDCAKYLNPNDFEGFKVQIDLPEPIVHAFLGSYIAEKVLGESDSQILDAIKYHTTGRAGMSELEKLVFVADMVEEGRSYEGVDELRYYYENYPFDQCFKKCLSEELIHLKNKGQPIYVETINAYNFYCKQDN